MQAIKVQKVTLEDHGQDFTDWYVLDGVVIDCQPQQGVCWVGTRLEFPEGPLTEGGPVHYRSSGTGDVLRLNYPIESIVELEGAEAEKVLGYGCAWAKKRNIDPADWGLVEVRMVGNSMSANAVALSAAETKLFLHAVSAAASAYHRSANVFGPGAPAFGMDDQPAQSKSTVDLMACNACILMLSELRELKKALSTSRNKHPLIERLEFEGDSADYAATVNRGDCGGDKNSLILQAIYSANVQMKQDRRTMKVIERLL
ncbi:hypothetical protein ACT3R7_11970 [Halomonas sp. AOP43-A1-21]